MPPLISNKSTGLEQFISANLPHPIFARTGDLGFCSVSTRFKEKGYDNDLLKTREQTFNPFPCTITSGTRRTNLFNRDFILTPREDVTILMIHVAKCPDFVELNGTRTG